MHAKKLLDSWHSFPTCGVSSKYIDMKKIVFLFVGALMALGAFAQTTPTKKAAEKDLRKDVKELKVERKERNKKIAKGQFKKASKDQKEINADRKHMNANKKHLKNKGVKHPIEKAKEEVKTTNP